MTHSLGALHEFHPNGEDFSTYVERVQIFFAANDVPEAKQVPVFLNAVGGNTYGVLRSLLSPDNPMSKSFTDIVAILNTPFTLATENGSGTVRHGIRGSVNTIGLRGTVLARHGLKRRAGTVSRSTGLQCKLKRYRAEGWACV